MTAETQPSALSPQPSKKGWINTFYRHHNGKKLGPYFVRRWKHNGRLHKEYIKPKDVARVKAECDSYRSERKRRQEVAKRELIYLDNHIFLARMNERFDKGKDIPAPHANWIVRLHKDGCYTPGRPRLRRRIVRRFAGVDGEEKMVTTIYEVDGTTRAFMVPLITRNYLDRLGDQIIAAWDTLVGPKTRDPLTT